MQDWPRQTFALAMALQIMIIRLTLQIAIVHKGVEKKIHPCCVQYLMLDQIFHHRTQMEQRVSEQEITSKGRTTMTSAEVIPLDPELREVLENLAGGLFPLDAWIKSKTYTPAEADLPWRKGTEPLSPKKIGVIQFFEALVRETAGDAHLIARWHQLIAEPLVFSPLAGMHEWRTRRGLEPEPEFGALESENVLTDFEGKPISRANFYAAYFPLLKQAVKAAAAQGPIQWEVFADNLFKDEKDVPAPVWPKGQPRRPSNFIKQFSRDLLYAMMGMRNAAPEPLKTALLTELGEHRRVGNDYKPEDTKNAVQEFKKVLQKVTQQPLPPTTPVPPSAPPLGSPRIGPPPVGSPSVVSTSPQPVAPLARQRK